jgi:hypothetical protein
LSKNETAFWHRDAVVVITVYFSVETLHRMMRQPYMKQTISHAVLDGHG